MLLLVLNLPQQATKAQKSEKWMALLDPIDNVGGHGFDIIDET